MLEACSERVPSEIQSTCKDCVLLNTFISLQATAMLASVSSQNASCDLFIKNIEQAREETNNYDFSKALRTDGKSFSDWTRHDAPVEIMVPHRGKNSTLTAKCKITQGHKGGYRFSYPINVAHTNLYAGRSVNELLTLLRSDDAWEHEKKILESTCASKKPASQNHVESGNASSDSTDK